MDHIENITHWQSIIAWGTFEELSGDDAKKATDLIVGRFTPILGGTLIQRSHAVALRYL